MKKFDDVILDYECTCCGMPFKDGHFLHIDHDDGPFIMSISIARMGRTHRAVVNLMIVANPHRNGAASLIRGGFSPNRLEDILEDIELAVTETLDENPYGVDLELPESNAGSETFDRSNEREYLLAKRVLWRHWNNAGHIHEMMAELLENQHRLSSGEE